MECYCARKLVQGLQNANASYLINFINSNSWNILSQLNSFKTEIKCATSQRDEHGLDGMFK